MEEGFGGPLKDRSASGSGLNSLFPGQSPYERVFPHAPVTMNCAAFPAVIGLIEVLWKVGVKACMFCAFGIWWKLCEVGSSRKYLGPCA